MTLREIFLLLVGVGAVFFLFFEGLGVLLKQAPDPIGPRADLFVEGARLTLSLTVSAGLLGIGIGVITGLGKLSRLGVFRFPCEFFVWLVRGTPLLVQILFVYYAVPGIFPAIKLGEFSAAALALAFNVGAYNAEVIRAGVLAIPRGQTEAARSLGLSKFKTLRWITLPQAFRVVIPPLINNIVALLKDSSLASVIGLLELSLAGNRISSETFLPVPVLTTVALTYLSLTTAITVLTHFFEKRLKTGATA